MIVNPRTIKRNCSNPGTRFDFSRRRTSNTTIYKIVPAARPEKRVLYNYLISANFYFLPEYLKLCKSYRDVNKGYTLKDTDDNVMLLIYF